MNRGPWTQLEDIRLLELYKRYDSKWSKIAKKVTDRTESNIKNRIISLLNKEQQMIVTSSNKPVVDQLIMKLRMSVSQEVGGTDEKSVSPASGSGRRRTSSSSSLVTMPSFSDPLEKPEPEMDLVKEKLTPSFGTTSFPSFGEIMDQYAK